MIMTETEKMYAGMKPVKLFFIVAMPGMISMLAMSIYTIIEGAFIGQILGEEALAAVNIAIPLVLINFSLSDLIGVGASVPISIALGKKDGDTANNVFTCSVLMIFFSSVIMGSVMYLAAEPLCSFMGADDELLDTSVRYLRTYALCSPLSTVFFAMDNYLRISGYIKTSMVINICSNLATILLLILFLVVMEMDVVGSALAASISMCACSAAAILPFAAKRALLKFVKPRFSVAMLREIAACGSPVFFSNISGRVTSILMNISLMALGVRYLGENGGTTAVAAYSVLMYVSDMCQPMLYGISDSLSPAIGYNYGANDLGRVRSIAKCGYIGTCIVSLTSAAMMFILSDTLAALFSNAEDVRLLELAAHAIRLFCLTYLFRWVSITTQSFLSAIERPKQATAVAIATALVFPVIMLLALGGIGLDGIWLNMVGTSVLSAVLCAFLLWRVMRELKKMQR